ncbi:ABC transporter ATP-binding protein [Streptomyces zingiberis]|uniref:ATP-binding cassette domain-containing protein n=1 Tax=Streptomyces zingiberis TaxID=2053010 RepID=A0ABX1C0K0_9ACTN|nr:ATP-binding cassette domain-containing protein [Streptomyces zingiberis]NJQ02276.1 ATP-binding cassette domain-containing protein [Streptomyces zingiberis]
MVAPPDSTDDADDAEDTHADEPGGTGNPTATDTDVLRAEALHYAADGVPVLADVSLTLREGEILAVTGPPGSGKTALLRCLAGQVVPDSGKVWFRGSPVHPLGAAARERLRRDHFGWVGTQPQLVPELTAWENTALPLLLRGVRPRAARAAATDWLARLDVGHRARSRPAALNRTERQRVAVARALAARPAVLFADDPVAGLHSADRALVLRTLLSAARSHAVPVVLASHAPETATLADRALGLVDGRATGAPAVTCGPARPAGSGRAGRADGADGADGAGRSGGPGGSDDSEGKTTCSLSV